MQLNQVPTIPTARCEGVYIGGNVNYAELFSTTDELDSMSIDLVLRGEHYWVQFIPEGDGYYPIINNTSLSKLIDRDFGIANIFNGLVRSLKIANLYVNPKALPIDRDTAKWSVVNRKVDGDRPHVLIVDGNGRPIAGYGRYPEVGVEWCIFCTINEYEMSEILRLKQANNQ